MARAGGYFSQNIVGKRQPTIEIKRIEPDYCEFLLKGTDASVANALRRVILAEVS
jgi:DNA-directed RNA polymerase II subunit RPB3